MTIKTYRKKPVVIEAMLFTMENKNEVFHWVTDNKAADFDIDDKPVLQIQTLEGVMTAQLGDYIIQGVMGEFYPCKPNIFNQTYEEVTL